MFQTEFVKSDNQNFSVYWNELVASCELRNPLYNLFVSDGDAASLECEHVVGGVSDVEKFSSLRTEGDFSFVLLENSEPILACSILLSSDENGQRRLGYKGLGAATHFSQSALDTSSNNISSVSFRALTEYIKRLLHELEPDVIEFQDTLSCGVMSPVSQYLIANGGLPIVSTAKLLNLAPSSRSLVRDVSKAVRSGIQWGGRNLQLSVCSDNLALYDYFKSHDLARRDGSCGIAVSLWQSKLELKSLLQSQLGFIVQATYEGIQVGSAVFACQNGTAQYLGCLANSTDWQKEIIFSLVWKGVLHAKAIACSELILDHHFDRKSESLIDFGGFGGEGAPRVKILWRKS